MQQAVTGILQKYLDTFYRRRRERWEAHNLEYRKLDEDDPNLAFNREQVSEGKPAYIVRVPRSEKDLLEKIQKLIEDANRLYQQEDKDLPRIYFDGHLYLPLLVQELDKLKSTPPALNESEASFLRDLKSFWEQEKDASMEGKEIYVLRNLSRGKGVGFFENSGFYPDFIIWIIDGIANSQRIIFVEPHGMLYAKAYIHDEKAKLHEKLPQLAQEIAHQSGQTNISLDAFIISATPFEELRLRYDDGTWDREKFAQKHILFLDDPQGYLRKIFSTCTDSPAKSS